MSFASLRSVRKAKEAQSFVKSSGSHRTVQDNTVLHAPGHEDENASTSIPSHPVVPREELEKLPDRHSPDLLEVVDTDGLYKSLPSSLEIRNVRDAGRGMFTKERRKAGTLSSVLIPNSQQ